MKTQAGIVALALIVATQGTGAQQAPALPADGARNVTVDDLDKGITAFKSMLWTLPSRAAFLAPDHTGAKLDGDLASHVLSDASLARLDSLSAQARAAIPAGSTFIPAEKLAPLNELMATESCRMMVVSGYWQARAISAYHEDLTRRLVERLPAALKTAPADKLTALGVRINNLRPAMTTDVARCSVSFIPDSTAITAIMIDYNKVRQEAAASLRQHGSDNTEPLRRKRPTACPTTVPASGTGDSRVRVISRMSPEDFYPAVSVARQVEGRVNLALTYDATGCVVETEIYESSGAEELDKAGLEYGLGTVLQAPVVDGVPMAGKVLSAVVFTMQEPPETPPPQRQLQP